MAEPTPEGTYAVNQACVEEVVADKGYHSNEVVRDLIRATLTFAISACSPVPAGVVAST